MVQFMGFKNLNFPHLMSKGKGVEHVRKVFNFHSLRSRFYRRVRLVVYYQKLLVANLDHFCNMTPPVYGVSASAFYELATDGVYGQSLKSRNISCKNHTSNKNKKTI